MDQHSSAEDSARILAQASALCAQTAAREVADFGMLPPSVATSPLEAMYTREDYEMMDRDEATHLLYLTAVRNALDDISKKRALEDGVKPQQLRVLVAGAGFGRLIMVALDAAMQLGITLEVHAFDANETATEQLNARFTGVGNVTVHDTYAILPSTLVSDLPAGLSAIAGGCDLVLLEIIGSFGDNEFLPEISSVLFRYFARARTGVVIPKEWSTYVAPVSCPETYAYVTLLQLKQAPTAMSLLLHSKAEKRLQAKELPSSIASTRCHVIDRTGVDFLAEPMHLYRGVCTQPERRYAGRATFTIKGADDVPKDPFMDESLAKRQKLSKDASAYIHGLAGYFTVKLYGDIFLDSRHSSLQRNCFHWEAFFFPWSVPVAISSLPLDKITGQHVLHVAVERIYKEEMAMIQKAPAGIEMDMTTADATLQDGSAQQQQQQQQHIMWYEWSVLREDSETPKLSQNVDGCDHVFQL